MKIILNGEEVATTAKTLDEFIKSQKIQNQVMAAAVNMEIVKKSDWNSFELKNGDKVELLRFVGGG
ncbi:MAG: sulfur carrier protein ThiS [Campylobacteraceae bacterium]|jgi:sulfur carrier protein|nr:sulfur carrier protein ThiS [Campylobacteraceae bacterium]